jgi:hypothetical protein
MRKQKRIHAIITLCAVSLVAGACSSQSQPQPRFTFVGNKDSGEHRYDMFDSKTAQICWAGPVKTNDGKDDLEIAKKKHPSYENLFSGNPIQEAVDTAEVRAAQDRVNRLKEHPEEMKVKVNGLPYCADLK